MKEYHNLYELLQEEECQNMNTGLLKKTQNLSGDID